MPSGRKWVTWRRAVLPAVVVVSLTAPQLWGAARAERADPNPAGERAPDAVREQVRTDCSPSVHAEAPDSVSVAPDGPRYVLDPGLFSRGGPPPDGIPSIDAPSFTSVNTADGWLDDDDLIIVLEHNRLVRGYPFRMLVRHEIVNDTVGGDPIVVTYCPLCGSGIAYVREVDCEPVEFGTSGLLYNSNLVMYDRLTRSLWTQIGGEGVFGQLSGQKLRAVPVDVVKWGEWSPHHPSAEILDPGSRPYDYDPYQGYDEDLDVWFPVTNVEDGRYHPKAVVFGVALGGAHKAYFEDAVKERAPFDDVVGGVRIHVERNESGLVTFTNLADGTTIAKERDFWFSWFAFYPETEIFALE